ncbi:hypothetical protein [Klebsiella variicola]|uniref:hypothetical protein n=1 Tax=Klebsiella variicola TaxID=244366 RepID=UPI0035B19276
MTDITELAQSHELLIANGQQTADLLRHLADNEIDSDYFAVVSECESYGKETDAELSITEFALRAAGYVDALVEALEKAQGMEAYWKTQCRGITDHCEELQARIAELESRTVTAAAAAVLAERKRQVAAEGWTPGHDDEYEHGELADAAGCYALSSELFDCAGEPPRPWPWPDEWWTPTNRRRDLVKAGALILAEIERLDRAAGIKVEADSLDADVSNRNQPGMVVAVHIDVGDFVKFRGRVYEVKETDFDDHDVTLWFVCGEVLKCAAGCPIEVVSAPVEDE